MRALTIPNSSIPINIVVRHIRNTKYTQNLVSLSSMNRYNIPGIKITKKVTIVLKTPFHKNFVRFHPVILIRSPNNFKCSQNPITDPIHTKVPPRSLKLFSLKYGPPRLLLHFYYILLDQSSLM